MRTSLAGRRGRAARLATQLLVLALAACGGERRDETGAQSDSAGAAGTQAARPAACTQPPAVDRKLLSGSWAALTAWRVENDVAFADSNVTGTTARVRLCTTCKTVRLKIVSEDNAYCMSADSLMGTTRIAGVYVVEDGSVAPPGWGRTFSPGDSLLIFATDTTGPALLAYQVGTEVRTAPAESWAFRFCPDGHSSKRPVGRWRQKGTGEFHSEEAAAPGDGEDPVYGWMACASGCCQFYLKPPITDPGPDSPAPLATTAAAPLCRS